MLTSDNDYAKVKLLNNKNKQRKTWLMESVTSNMDQNLELATWNRARTSEELINFINQRHADLPDDIDE